MEGEFHPDIIGSIYYVEQRERGYGGSGQKLPPIIRASRQLRVIYECERCAKMVYTPLIHGECGYCKNHPEEITPERIEAEAAAIREGWNKRDWRRQPDAPKPWRPPGSKFDETKYDRK